MPLVRYNVRDIIKEREFYMKFKKYIALMLALVLVLSALTGCSSKGKTLMTLEKEKISVNTFYLFLSRMKGYFVADAAYGESARYDSFWETLMSTDGTTYDTFYTNQVLDNMKSYIAALHLFRERGLKLPDETIDAIDAELQEIIDIEWNGSKTEFNAKLAEYGANYEVLREAKIIEAKIDYLRADLFGENGEKIDSKLKEPYYQANYRRFKHMFFYTYKYVTEIDEEGNEKIVTGTDGYALTEDMTEAEIRLVIDRANEAMEKAVVKEKNGKKYGDEELFNSMLSEKNSNGKYVYNEDKGMQQNVNGVYVKRDSDYDSPEVVEALFEMEVGEIRLIRSKQGFHVLMRYENDEGAYANSANEGSFGGFIRELESLLMVDYLKPYKELVVVDEKAFKEISIKDVAPNLYY